MKKIIRLITLASIMSVGCLYSIIFAGDGAEKISQLVVNGVVWKNIQYGDPSLSIHIVEIDPACVDIKIADSPIECSYSETVLEIAKHSGALVAINGSFFDFYKTSPFNTFLAFFKEHYLGVSDKKFPSFGLKKEKNWLSLSDKETGFVAWNNDEYSMICDSMCCLWKIKLNNRYYPISDINKPYSRGPLLYTVAYGASTPIKDEVGLEIVVENSKIKKVLPCKGGINIPKAGFVYSIPSTYLDHIDLSIFALDTSVSIMNFYSNKDRDKDYNLEGREYFLGSTPLLVKDGAVTEQVEQSTNKFFTYLHPRTAVGVLEDGKVVFVIVDGRQKTSQGISLYNLASFMKHYGCVSALNLDGGSSSTLVINNQIVNSPSRRRFGILPGQKTVANALIVVPKKNI